MKEITDSNFYKLAITLIVLGTLTLLFFFVSLSSDFSLKFDGGLLMAETGQVGDFVGGVIGTLFALAGTLLLVVTLISQSKTAERNSIETSFFELVKLHKENVNETAYKKYADGENQEFRARKAFQVLFNEFSDCNAEVLKFFEGQETSSFLLPGHQNKLEAIIESNELQITSHDFCLMELSYTIFFFGVDYFGKRIIERRYKDKIGKEALEKLLFFLRLKARLNKKRDIYRQNWNKLLKLTDSEFHLTIDSLMETRESGEPFPMNGVTDFFSVNYTFTKFYGGHQHRLSHYFRHLFQSYEFLEKKNLTDKERYEYGKLLRSQLSTYEQILLYYNSVSELGWKWELKSEEGNKLITTYKLIKNVPDFNMKEGRRSTFYPKLQL